MVAHACTVLTISGRWTWPDRPGILRLPPSSASGCSVAACTRLRPARLAWWGVAAGALGVGEGGGGARQQHIELGQGRPACNADADRGLDRHVVRGNAAV